VKGFPLGAFKSMPKSLLVPSVPLQAHHWPLSRNLDTQDTVILTGAAPSLPSFTPLASLNSPAAIYSFLTDIPAEEEAEAVELAKPDLKIDKELTEEAEECVKERETGSGGEDERSLDREEYFFCVAFVFSQ